MRAQVKVEKCLEESSMKTESKIESKIKFKTQ